MVTSNLPQTHRALVLNSTRDPYDMIVVSQPTPSAVPGSAIVRVLASSVLTYAGEVYTGRRAYPYPTPFVPGSSAIGRIAAVGADATSLKPGQLVYVDCFIRGRDDPSVLILHGLHSGHTPGGKALFENEWRNGTYAEYTKVPLENCFPLNEEKLLGSPSSGGFGYKVEDLMYLGNISVSYGGLRDIGIEPGDKVVITPATGAFGCAAVKAALAMGAQVIAMGRNREALETLMKYSPEGRVRTVVNTGDVEADKQELLKHGPLDAFFDISPREAANSTHFKSCIQALKRGGKVSLMGAQMELSLPVFMIMYNDITIKGKWMYERKDILSMIRLAEEGYLKLGEVGHVKTAATFPLEKFAEAFDAAAKNSRTGGRVVILP